jgi:thiol-disulfide isomerase/thioredoxin
LSGNIVLFFHADWCPTCRQAEENFIKSGIPENLTILKVNFDTATDLRKKYSVLTQTSFVSITSD